MGTKKLYEYAEEYKIDVDPSVKELLGKHTEKQWDTFKNNRNEHLYSEEAVDLLSRMLQYDHTKRITAREAMGHSYFADLK